jgi:hypothetical protein
MDSDIRLDGNTTTIEGDFLRTTAVDVVVDAPSRRRAAGGNRRAIVHNFNDGLTLNWASDYPDGVTIEGFRLTCKQADLVLDFAGRRRNNTPWRRALVHDFNDGLTLNWANDYPGGVTINGNVTVPGQLLVPNRAGAGSIDVASELLAMKNRIAALETRLTALGG